MKINQLQIITHAEVQEILGDQNVSGLRYKEQNLRESPNLGG